MDEINFLESELRHLDIFPVEEESHRGAGDTLAITLSEGDESWFWDLPSDGATFRGNQGYEELREYEFKAIPPNQFCSRLRALDHFFTPKSGMFKLTNDYELLLCKDRGFQGTVLLFVHGTFCSAQRFLQELLNTEDGIEYLRRALSLYDQVLFFSHPTISVSPILNALELADFFTGFYGNLDVICHSRGGVVVRWFVEKFLPHTLSRSRVCFVGAPLGGTSIATSASFRSSVDLMVNYSKAMAKGAVLSAVVAPMAIPFFQASAVFAGLIACLGRAGKETLDLLVAVAPGILAISRQGENGEIAFLRESFHRKIDRMEKTARNYSFIGSNFESEAGHWNFRRFFVKEKKPLTQIGANFIFDCPNDLVVDTGSMFELSDHEVSNNFDCAELLYGKDEQVHHCNYFSQKKTFDFFSRVFD